MLECSLKSAEALFPEADRVVCHNNLTPEVAGILGRLARDHHARLFDSSELLPSELRNTEVKNSWWKYAPTRLAAEKYEIVMDNDVVLWRIPPSLGKGIEAGDLVALTDAAGQYYGDFQDSPCLRRGRLALNAGMLGMPPGFAPELGSLGGMTLKDYFHSEQGFTAMAFTSYPRGKRLVSLEEVAQLNVMEVEPADLVSMYSGGHFCGCSFGHFDFWEKKYASEVKRKLGVGLERLGRAGYATS